MTFQHYTPQTLAWRTSSCLCRSPDQEKEDEDHISYFERVSAKELGQSVWCRQMQRWLDFKFSSSPKDPKRAPTGLGNSTDCGVRDSQRKVKRKNTPRLKHKNTGKVKHTSTVIDPMIALWCPSNVSRATYDNLHQLTIAKIISSVRSSNSHPDLLVIQHHHHHPTFSDHTGPQHWTFTFWATTAI